VTCADCKFVLIAEGSDIGICRRFPPVGSPVLEVDTQFQFEPIRKIDLMARRTAWPAIHAGDWCGEWQKVHGRG
jgi:hypothetical protein